MKFLAICLLLLIPAIVGCQQSEVYFYSPDKTLDQAKQDCETCHEALVRATVGGTSYSKEAFESVDLEGDKCMELKGYSLVPANQLPDNVSKLTLRENLLRHYVAGK